MYYNKIMFLNSSIAKKQTVAITGFLLILFIITHLGGNLLIYAGPDVFNSYAHKLHSIGPLLLIPRGILLAIFLLHIFVIHILVIQNIKARGGLKRYAIDQAVGKRTLAERIMPWSGLYILVFVVFHILDFAAADQHGPRSYIHGTSYGLYGLVFNSFKDPIHGFLYIVAVCFLGMHLSHGVQSLFQTGGFRPKWEPFIQKCSDFFSWIMVIGYSSIPVYVYCLSH
jgi:succinate dehydrogenase / fumarate reductase cytochrome b subunit